MPLVMRLTTVMKDATMRDRFLPGVPTEQITEIYNAAPGNEITSGKFDSAESSAALVTNAFVFVSGGMGYEIDDLKQEGKYAPR